MWEIWPWIYNSQKFKTPIQVQSTFKTLANINPSYPDNWIYVKVLEFKYKDASTPTMNSHWFSTLKIDFFNVVKTSESSKM